MNARRIVVIAAFATGCGTSSAIDATVDAAVDAGQTDTAADDAADSPADQGTAPNCPVASMVTPMMLGSITSVVAAAVADLNGDGRVDVAVATANDGVWTFLSTPCGALQVGSHALAGESVTGIDTGQLIDTTWDVVALTSDGLLHALEGTNLSEMWSASFSTELGGAPGVTLAMRLAAVPVDQAAAFSATYSTVLRIQNTGSAWHLREQLELPEGILGVAAGPLGGPRDTLLFEGFGLVEVVCGGDFSCEDIRMLSSANHAAAAFADFNGDGNPDTLVGSNANVELWTGDGTATLTRSGVLASASDDVIGLAAYDPSGSAVKIGAVLTASGQLTTVSASSTGTLSAIGTGFSTSANALAVFGGDVDGDSHDDLIVIDTDGTAFVMRSP